MLKGDPQEVFKGGPSEEEIENMVNERVEA
jgi:hypothetical protein